MFQIFAQLIELHAPPLPPLYMQLFKPLLAPLFWERPGNVPALARLLRAYLAKAGAAIVEQGLLQACPCDLLLWCPVNLSARCCVLALLVEGLPACRAAPWR